MAMNHVALGLTAADAEASVVIYIIRLVAFVAILAGIVDKNRR